MTGLLVLAMTAFGGSSIADPGATRSIESASDGTVDASDWVVKSADSICGVSSARQITNPAKVDYDKLLAATSEMQEIRKENIDKSSARGQALVTKAANKVRVAAKGVMTEKGHCSVWKEITNKEGKEIADLTSAILEKID